MAEEDKKEKPDDTKPEEPKKPGLEEKKEAEKPAGVEEKKLEESKEAPQQLSLPQEVIVLKVFMHCEGCARKVRRCLKGFEGVESVETDCKTHKVIVKGEKADPLKVLERVQRKSHRQVELISPIPNPPAPLPLPLPLPLPQIENNPKTEDKKLQIITVVLKVHMHCEACAQEIKRRMQKMKGVESVEADLKSSQVTVKGAFDPPTLVEYVYKRTGKHAVIVKQEPQNENKEEAKEKIKENAIADGGGGESETVKKGDGGETEKKVEEESKEEKAGGGGDGGSGEGEAKVAEVTTEEVSKVVEMEVKKNEYYHNYPHRYIMEMYAYPPQMVGDAYSPAMVVESYTPQIVGGVAYAYPPQMFSDENPNACSVM